MKFGLKNIDSEDLEDVIVTIEESFLIKLDEDSTQIKNLGELCDYVVNKIKLEEVDDCTSQQAFYKLRDTIAMNCGINRDMIEPGTSLRHIFPSDKRRTLVKAIETDLGHKINLLKPPYWIMAILFIVFTISIILLFIKWQAGLVGLLFSIIGFMMATKFGKCLAMDKVKDVTNKMASFRYMQSRRNIKTFNKTEIESTIINIFEEHLGPFEPKLDRDSSFI